MVLRWLRKAWVVFDYTLTGIEVLVFVAFLVVMLGALLLASMRWVGSMFGASF